MFLRKIISRRKFSSILDDAKNLALSGIELGSSNSKSLMLSTKLCFLSTVLITEFFLEKIRQRFLCLLLDKVIHFFLVIVVQDLLGLSFRVLTYATNRFKYYTPAVKQ